MLAKLENIKNGNRWSCKTTELNKEIEIEDFFSRIRSIEFICYNKENGNKNAFSGLNLFRFKLSNPKTLSYARKT